MNKVCLVFLIILFSVLGFAQEDARVLKLSNIDPYHLAVSDKKTTNLIFPYGVKRVHCSSKQLNIEQMKDVKNILLVTSVTSHFEPTNVSVVTSDGRFYSFYCNMNRSLHHSTFVLRQIRILK